MADIVKTVFVSGGVVTSKQEIEDVAGTVRVRTYDAADQLQSDVEADEPTSDQYLSGVPGRRKDRIKKRADAAMSRLDEIATAPSFTNQEAQDAIKDMAGYLKKLVNYTLKDAQAADEDD